MFRNGQLHSCSQCKYHCHRHFFRFYGSSVIGQLSRSWQRNRYQQPERHQLSPELYRRLSGRNSGDTDSQAGGRFSVCRLVGSMFRDRDELYADGKSGQLRHCHF